MLNGWRPWSPWHRGVLAATLGVAAIAVVGCGSGGSSSSAGSGSGKSAASGGGHEQLALIPGVKGDVFYISLACGASEEAQRLGVSLNVQAPDQFDPSSQAPVVNAVAAKHPDATLVAPVDDQAMYVPIKQLADQGSKIVFVDTKLKQDALAVSGISTDNYQGGRAAAQALAKLVGGSGKVMLVNFKPGVSTTDARGRGFVDGAKAAGLDIVSTQYTENDPAKTASAVNAALAKYPDLKGIFTTQGYSADGAVTGLRQTGKLGQVKVVGFDSTPNEAKELAKGELQALVTQQARVIGKQGVRQAVAALRGKPTRRVIPVKTVTITKDNLHTPDSQLALEKDHC